MGKRGATQAAGAKKAARKAEPEPAKEECAPVSELLGMMELSASCREMLMAMAPFSLKAATAGARHEYQEKMNSTLATLFGGITEARAAAVHAAEAEAAAVEKEREEASKVADAAAEKEAAEMAVRDAKVAANTEAENAAGPPAVALAVAKEKVASFESEQKAVVDEKAEYEALVGEKLAQLKEGAFPGQMWRQRDKLIAEIEKALEAVSPEEASIRSAFAAAMKLKPEVRGIFAGKAIEYAESLLAKQIEALTAQIANGEAEAAARAQAVTAAEEALKAAEQARDASQEAYIAADNTLLEATERKNQANKAVKDFQPRVDELAAALAAARESLDGAQALVAQFDGLWKGAPEEEPAAAEEAPAEVAPMEEEAPVA